MVAGTSDADYEFNSEEGEELSEVEDEEVSAVRRDLERNRSGDGEERRLSRE